MPAPSTAAPTAVAGSSQPPIRRIAVAIAAGIDSSSNVGSGWTPGTDQRSLGLTRRSAGLGPFHDFEDAVGDQAVRLAVDAHRRFRVGRLDQAECLPLLLVEPV